MTESKRTPDEEAAEPETEGIRILGDPARPMRPSAADGDPARPVIRVNRPEVRDPSRLGPVPVIRADEPPPRSSGYSSRRATDATEISVQPTLEQRTGITVSEGSGSKTPPVSGTRGASDDDLEAWSSLLADGTAPDVDEAALDAVEADQPKLIDSAGYEDTGLEETVRAEVDVDLTGVEAAGFARPAPDEGYADEAYVDDDPDGIAILAGDGEFERDADAFFGFDEERPDPDIARSQRRPLRAEMTTPTTEEPVDPRPAGAGRNIGVAAAVGLGLAALGGLALFLGGPFTAVLIIAILAVCAVEFFNAVLRAGFAPATLLGLMAVVALPAGVYWKGAEAYPVVLYLSVLAGLAWYLFGVTKDRPVRNLGVTLLGIFYIGGLGSFGVRIADETLGISTLLSAILLTIAYDVGGYAIGRTAGRTPLSAASPNKTWEGLIGGAVVSMVTAVIAVGIFNLGVFGGGNLVHALALGLVVPVAAALGDLSESLIKRDLGIKDMSEFLPGHGGFLDRFDAMLFVLPATYYLAVALDLFQQVAS